MNLWAFMQFHERMPKATSETYLLEWFHRYVEMMHFHCIRGQLIIILLTFMKGEGSQWKSPIFGCLSCCAQNQTWSCECSSFFFSCRPAWSKFQKFSSDKSRFADERTQKNPVNHLSREFAALSIFFQIAPGRALSYICKCFFFGTKER